MSQTLSQIKTLLRGHGLRPKKRFGQNFLHDGNLMSRLVDAAQLRPGEHVLEVGPGTGSLSLRLLEAGVKLLAIEVDGDLELILRNVLALETSPATLIIGDVLAGKHRLDPMVVEALPDVPFKLVANLPYNVASPLLANLVTDYPKMALAVATVQREVAQRICAAPGSKDYGPLGILLQAMCEIERIAHVPPSCFWPVPEVDSTMLRLRRRETPLTREPHRLAELLQRLFRQRRKQLGTILGRTVPLPPGINSSDRPEQLTVQQLITLARHAG